jgi:formamidopyrimidine-DNA glycosylase
MIAGRFRWKPRRQKIPGRLGLAAFPEKVTALRPKMAAHGKYAKPCPVCGDPIQRILFTDRETNYCSICQTGGKFAANRSLSRLLKGD